MSTWNSLTVERTDGHLIESLDEIRETLVAHGFEIDGFADSPLDYIYRHVSAAEAATVDRRVVNVGWHSKYQEGDAAGLAATLGVGWTVTHSEEWDDEGPGASEAVYVDGVADGTSSNGLRTVSDALAHLNLSDRETVAAILAILPRPGVAEVQS